MPKPCLSAHGFATPKLYHYRILHTDFAGSITGSAPEPWSICAVWRDAGEQGESEANARLIAAAPRMREGLETIANVGSGEAKRIALEILREIDAEAHL